jgi:hypothetical protein
MYAANAGETISQLEPVARSIELQLHLNGLMTSMPRFVPEIRVPILNLKLVTLYSLLFLFVAQLPIFSWAS